MRKLTLLLCFFAILSSGQAQLVVNEVLYDPSNNALDGDANGDGTYSQDDDSFIELYNSGSTAVNVGGYEIWDDTTSGGTNQYTIPTNTSIPAGEVLVVFGGGTLTGSFGTAVTLNAGSGLNFNNSGEVIGVKDNAGNWALVFDSDALSNNPNESYTRNPDVTSAFEQHGDNTPLLFSPGTKVDGSAFNPAPSGPPLIMNEVLYDPSNNGLDGDANGDGVYDQNDDSFLEIYNPSSNPVDISGYEIWDDTTSGGSVQYTFPANTSIPAQEVVVVFGGATATGNFGSAVVLNAGSGLGFNNSGEVIGLKDTTGQWSLIFDSDARSGNPNESYTRFPDVTGNFLQHGDTTAVLFSPGTKTDGTAFNPTAPPAPSTPLILNEVLYDPSNNALDGDANGDSVYSQNDDSFLEIYNADSGSVDISGFEIWDDTASGGSNQYTFPAGSIIPSQEVMLLFGGGNPSGSFGSAVVQNAGSGLDLNNSGEVIGVKDTAGRWVLVFDSDARSGNPNESYTRFPDVTGNFLQHGDTTAVLFSPGTKTDGTAFNPAPPPAPSSNLIVNEVLYDPSNNGLDGDANGDGVYGQDDDSFIEIYNPDSTAFDISGYELWDDTASGTNQYTIPAGTTIPPQEVVVVFGGGTPTGTFGTAVVLKADSGLNFNNSGEVIGLKNTSGNWALAYDTEPLSNNPNESYTRNPDVTGPFEQHGDNTPVLFSPGTRVDGTAFNPTNSLAENQADFPLAIFPNPVRHTLRWKAPTSLSVLEIWTPTGRKLRQWSRPRIELEVASLPAGIYIIKAYADQGTATLRFVKQ